MNSLKHLRLSRLVVVPVLMAGLFFALRSNVDRHPARNPLPPGTFSPGDQGLGPAIIPNGNGGTNIEYRNILFRWNNGDKAAGPAEISL